MAQIQTMDNYLDELLEGTTPTTHIAFTGTGAQDKAREVGPFVSNVDRTLYYGYKTEDERRAHAIELIGQHHEVVERIDGSRPCRPCLDIDGDLKKRGTLPTDEELQEINDAFLEILRELEPTTHISVESYGYDINDKRSRHLIALGVRVSHGLEVKKIAKLVQGRVSSGAAIFVDPLGSNLSFGLRIPGCPKAGDVRKILLPLHEATSDDFYLQVEEDAPVISLGDEPVTPYEAVSPDSALEAFAAKIAKECPHLARETNPRGCVASYTRTSPAFCKSCERVHESDGAYVTVSGGSLYLNCRRAEKGMMALMTYRFEDEKMPETMDEFDRVTADETTTEQFNSIGFADAIGGVDDIYIRAPWKTGKTVLAAEIIKETLRTNSKAKILVISCRKTLTLALVSAFGATPYQKIKNEFDGAKASRHNITIWQIESLPRILSEVVFDLVIIDEPAADLAHIFQPGAGSKARAGLSKARGFIQTAGRIYVSDNDLSAAHVDMFKAIRGEKPARVLVNEFKSWEDVGVDLYHGSRAEEVVRQKLFEFLDAQAVERAAGRPYSGATIPCHSRALATGLYTEIAERYGKELARIWTSETDQKDKAKDFTDINAAVAGISGGVYTATVSVGIDITSPHISNVFAFFVGNNAGTQQSAQMIFRARALKHVTIAFTGKPVHGLPQTPTDLFAWATMAANRGYIPDQLRADCSPMIDTPTHSDPLALADIVGKTFEGKGWVCDMMERHRSQRWFVPRLVRMLAAAGCVVNTMRAHSNREIEGLDLDPAELKRVAERGQEAKAAAEDTRNAIASKEFGKTLATARACPEENDDNRELTAEEIQGRRALFAAKAYAEVRGISIEELEALSADDRAAWIGFHAAPKALKAYRALADIVSSRDRFRTPDGVEGIQTSTSSNAEACAIVRRAFKSLGAETALTTGEAASVPMDQLRAPSDELMDVVNEINTHSLRVFGCCNGARRRKALEKDPAPRKITGTMDVALGFVGASLVLEYNTEADRARRHNPIGYGIEWKRLSPEAPFPHPKHPKAFDGKWATRQTQHDGGDIDEIMRVFEGLEA